MLNASDIKEQRRHIVEKAELKKKMSIAILEEIEEKLGDSKKIKDKVLKLSHERIERDLLSYGKINIKSTVSVISIASLIGIKDEDVEKIEDSLYVMHLKENKFEPKMFVINRTEKASIKPSPLLYKKMEEAIIKQYDLHVVKGREYEYEIILD